jgi:hypothetical protein
MPHRFDWPGTRARPETGSTASQVLDASAELSRQATRLNGEIDTFLTKLGIASLTGGLAGPLARRG